MKYERRASRAESGSIRNAVARVACGPISQLATLLVFALSATAQSSASSLVREAQLAQLIQKSEAGAYIHFGSSAGLDGDTAIVGAPGADGDAGAAYVYIRSQSNWTRQAILSSSRSGEISAFGCDVALEGDTAVIGAAWEDGHGAAYVFVRDNGAWTQQARLLASDAAPNDFFGISVAISGDTVIVGAGGATLSGQNSAGAAYVFVRAGSTWSQQAKLAATVPSVIARFGCDVSIDADTVAVGENRGGAKGRAYVFVRNAGVWSLQAALQPADAASGDQFGSGVSLAGDALAVGAPLQTVAGHSSAGAVYAYVRAGTTWTLQSKLTTQGVAREELGHDVSLEGDVLVAGAPMPFVGTGRFHVFTRSGAAWTHQAMVIPAATNDQFGSAVCISDGTILSGAYYETTPNGSQEGSAYVYVGGGATWQQESKFTLVDNGGLGSGDHFGTRVAMSGDRAVVGGGGVRVFHYDGVQWVLEAQLIGSDTTFGIPASLAFSGDTIAIGKTTGVEAVYVFVRTGSLWTQQAKILPVRTSTDYGKSAALSGDTLVVGAPRDYLNSNQVGLVHVYIRSGTTWTHQAALNMPAPGNGDYFGWSVSIEGDRIAAGALNDNLAQTDQGSAHTFVRNGATWAHEAELVQPDPIAFANLGSSIALSGDTVAVSANRDSGPAGVSQGAVYLWTRGQSGWSLQQKVTPPDAQSSDIFGTGLALDGDVLWAGSPQKYNYSGAAYAFVRSGAVWMQVGEIHPNPGNAQPRTGESIACSGARAVIGMPEEPSSGVGQVEIFRLTVCDPVLSCDTNCDGSVNLFDIQSFVDNISGALTPCAPCAADVNGDGSINLFDIGGFVDCLSS